MLSSPYPKPSLLPPPEHPRLMLTRRDLPRIRENMAREENAAAVRVWEKLLARPVTAKGATPAFGTYDLSEVLSLEALAFRFLLSGDPTDAAAAVSAADLLLSSFTVTGGNMGARWSGHLIFACAEVYDWCYDLIPAEQKTRWIARCEELAAAYFEMGYPPERQTAVVGHGTEAQLLRDLLGFAVAVYDERPDIYDFCAGRILSEYVPEVRAFFAGGAHNQGPTYGSYRWTWLAFSELLFESMTGKTAFDDLTGVAEWLLYMTRPDGEALRLGDDFNETKAAYNRHAPFAVPFFFAYALSGRDDFYRQFAAGFDERFLLPEHCGMDFYAESSWGEGVLSPVVLLVFDRFHGLRHAAPLPACRYFGSPVGETVFRDGDLYVFLKIGEFWGANHDHLDTGCFQIFSGAPLLTDSGVYDSYGSPHRYHYLIHTAAHNCLTVEVPGKPLYGEWKESARYDGGTRRPAGGHEPATAAVAFSEEYRMAHVLSHQESADGCQLVGDLTPAYAHTCARVVRAMTYDHPARTLTVTDEVTSFDPAAVKTLHLHCLTEPRINGNTVTFENGGHRAVCRVVSPAAVRISAVGGEGREFMTDGENFAPQPPYTAEAGWGQVRITAAEQTEKTVFRLAFTVD